MERRRSRGVRGGLATFFAAAGLDWGEASAQQAIVSLPSADVTPEGYGFFMHESQLAPTPNGGALSWDMTHFLTYGLGAHTELALTHFGEIAPDAGSRQTLAFGFKSSVPLVEPEEADLIPRVTVGAMGLASLVDASMGAWVYGLGSLELEATGIRVAVGLSFGTEQLFGVPRALAFVASVEQRLPFVKGLTLVAEWFSGDHDLGNFIAGLAYHPDHTWIFVAGWKLSTRDADLGREDHGAVAEVGVFWH